uniref:Putative secreted protein n=1 Tax=Ixodes ricinus TaxID=34613 RepID=A0A6B0UKL4_IXORI
MHSLYVTHYLFFIPKLVLMVYMTELLRFVRARDVPSRGTSGPRAGCKNIPFERTSECCLLLNHFTLRGSVPEAHTRSRQPHSLEMGHLYFSGETPTQIVPGDKNLKWGLFLDT